MSSISPFAVAQLNQRLDAGDDVLPLRRVRCVSAASRSRRMFILTPAHGAQVVALAVEEQLVEERRGGIGRSAARRGRMTR